MKTIIKGLWWWSVSLSISFFGMLAIDAGAVSHFFSLFLGGKMVNSTVLFFLNLIFFTSLIIGPTLYKGFIQKNKTVLLLLILLLLLPLVIIFKWNDVTSSLFWLLMCGLSVVVFVALILCLLMEVTLPSKKVISVLLLVFSFSLAFATDPVELELLNQSPTGNNKGISDHSLIYGLVLFLIGLGLVKFLSFCRKIKKKKRYNIPYPYDF